MTLKALTKLGDNYNCATSGNRENFEILHLDAAHVGDQLISVRFSQSDELLGSVHLTREKVEELATTLLFWLDQTDPTKKE